MVEGENREPQGKETALVQRSYTSMLDFCKMLHQDISADLEGWASFVDYRGEDVSQKQNLLIHRLQKLEEWIEEREEQFDENHCFL